MVLSSERAALGEGIIATDAGIGWVDIPAATLWWRPRGGTPLAHVLDARPSVILEVRDDGILVGDEEGVAVVDPDGRVTRLATFAERGADERANDGVLLGDGTILLGTMSTVDPGAHPGRLHRLAAGASDLEPVGPPLGIPNAFIPLDDGTVLVADSHVPALWRVDPADGTASPHPVDARLRPGAAPDGGCRTGDAALLALWDGWGIAVLDLPAGRVATIHDLPVPRPTNCAVDPVTGRLVVTTASEGLDAAQLADAPLSGHVLSIAWPPPGS